MKELFFGTGVAHSLLLFAFVIAIGLYLGRFKIKGISIGTTWVLFVGILMGHLGFRVDEHVLKFMKELGLILFVFSIGLQVGPGFFQSFKKGGVVLNVLAVCLVLLAMLTAVCIHFVTGESLQTLTGVMSGAVTNTPGLGAAQQTLSDCVAAAGGTVQEAADKTAHLASAYAVSYPMGVLGVIILLILFNYVFRIDLKKEKEELDSQNSKNDMARRMHCVVENPEILGKSIKEIVGKLDDKFVVSRIMRDGVISTPCSDTRLQQGDKVLIVTSQSCVDNIRELMGSEIPMHLSDWEKINGPMIARRLVISKSKLTGKNLRSLNIRALFGVNVTRVIRSGVELVASPDLILKMGDTLHVVGEERHIDEVANLVGNKEESLSHPNLVPIFSGIVLGIILGSIPMLIPGIPHPIKLGLAGGPLIVSILLGYFGPKLKITTYTTLSANMMIREIGISFFMAAVGLGAGEKFISSILNGGYWWILYGVLITMIPITIIMLVGRLVFKLNAYRIFGLISGGTTNPPVLAFAQNAYGTDYTSISYATVYPISMFMRVLVAQLLILLSL